MENQNSTLATAQALDSIASFIREYLVCDDHQLTALTLWIAHTWCINSFQYFAYLDVRSPEPQSGKSVCLRLMAALGCKSTYVSAATPGTFTERLLANCSLTHLKEEFEQDKDRQERPVTFIADDCHYSFGVSERQTAVAILTCGSEFGTLYSYGSDDYMVTGPKAFAGNAPLPDSLTLRCIPIVLRRKKLSEHVKQGSLPIIVSASENLIDGLTAWSSDAAARLQQSASKPVQLPPAFTPRQQQCAEPLLRIANLAGGPWPAKARTALATLFGASEYSDQVQVLRDIRDLFLLNGQPEKLPTRDLLSYLRSLENRPWSSWGSKSGVCLGALLRPFCIFSQDIKVDGESLKGYRSKDFQDAWERYAGLVADGHGPENPSATT
jgi:hypothetical protein